VGDEPKMELPSVFSGDAQEEKKEEKGGKGGSGNTLLYVIIGVLAVAVGFLFFKMKNKKA
jgi:LPXTG-motif cell wall-anchored protein